MSRKPTITVTARADNAKTAATELARRNPALARRLAGNPFGGGSRALPLKEPARWHTYIGNTYADEGEFVTLRELGWEPLRADDLACPVDESGYRQSVDGYLVRGPQGQEMLWKMSVEDYRLMSAAKTDANMKGIGSAKKIKQDMADAAAGSMGDEAANYIHNLDGQVVDRITGGEAG